MKLLARTLAYHSSRILTRRRCYRGGRSSSIRNNKLLAPAAIDHAVRDHWRHSLSHACNYNSIKVTSNEIIVRRFPEEIVLAGTRRYFTRRGSERFDRSRWNSSQTCPSKMSLSVPRRFQRSIVDGLNQKNAPLPSGKSLRCLNVNRSAEPERDSFPFILSGRLRFLRIRETAKGKF